MKLYDNGGKTFDRYTLITGRKEVYGFSENPLSPQGFNQFCGTWDDPNGDFENLGERVSLAEVPREVQAAIAERLRDSDNAITIDL